MTWTLAEIAAATGGRLARGDASAVVTRVATDSRQLAAGDLFVALRGPNFDGHLFAAEAVARGACGVVVAEELDLPAAVIRVPNTERALGDLAAHTRRRSGMTVFAIGGSNGKTTTKEMLACICETAWPGQVLKTKGNWNNLVGMPLTLLGWSGETVAVLELGMNRPGELARLTEIAAPDIALLTNISEEHLEGLGTIAGVAEAEGELFANLPASAVAAVNADDPWVRRVAERFGGRKLQFGAGQAVNAGRVTNLGADGVAFELHYGGATARVRLRLAGEHAAANAVAAAAAAHAAGVGLDSVVRGLEQVRPVPMRMEMRRLANQVTLIDDSYNANPGSVEAALKALVQLPGRSLAVVGEMLELGADRVDAHLRLGERAFSLGVDLLVVVGGVADVVASGAHAAGMRPDSVVACATHEEAALAVRARWRPGDAVLVKGSRGAHMERVVKLLENEGEMP